MTIHLRTPSGPFLPAQVLSSFAIQSPTALKKYGANQGELRNGVFYPTGVVRVQPPDGHRPVQVRVVDGRREGRARRGTTSYWGPKAKLKTLIIRPISDNTARLQALQTR